MTKGKLVLFILMLVLSIFDGYHIYNYGSPLINNPSIAQVIVVISLFLIGFALLIGFVVFIVSNWDEPFRHDRRKH